MKQHFGLNIEATSTDEKTVLKRVAQTGASTHVVISGQGLARKIYDQCARTSATEPIIASRTGWPDQDWKVGKYTNVRAYVESLKRDGVNPCYAYVLNEPVITNREDLKSLLQFLTDVMHESARQGVRCVIGNFADASNFSLTWLSEGRYDDFLHAASDYTNEGYGVIGHHSYTYGSLAHGGGGIDPWSMGTLGKMQKRHWPTKEQMTISGQGAEKNWLQMRYMWPLNRCVSLGHRAYKIFVTEAAHDRMPNGEMEGWIPYIEGLFVGGKKLFGPLDQRELWRAWWPEWSSEEAFFEQLNWWSSVQPEQVVGAALFTLSGNPRWESYNYENWPEVWPMFEAYARRTTMKALPNAGDPRWEAATVQAAGQVNYRSVPTTVGNTPLGMVKTGDRVKIVRDTAAWEGLWMPIAVNDIAAWVSSSVITFVSSTDSLESIANDLDQIVRRLKAL